MATELNEKALEHARGLIAAGDVDRNDRGEWSDDAPTPDEENGFIESDGWAAYAQWFLGVDPDENPETKQAYTFPYGDFRVVHRAGVIAAESRAGQHGHPQIERAAKELLSLIDEE